MKKILLLAATIFCFLNLINAQAGKLDPTFGTNGIVTTDLGESYKAGSSQAKQVLALSDGSIYVLQNSLSKRRANGSIDSSFGINGFGADAGLYPDRMAIGPDGKIVVSSDFRGLARYNTDGSVDSSFSLNGRLINDNYGNLVIQNDGKIILGGGGGVSRYNTDGSADTTFSGDGKLTTNSIYINSAAIQSDGKIVAAGYTGPDYEHSDFAVVRYNTNGSLDNSFSGDGIQTTNLGSHDIIYAVAIQSDRKIVVTGASGGYFALARYNIDGSLDKSFSGDGKQTANLSNNSDPSIAFEPNGKIVVSLSDTLIRYNTNGSPDSTIFKTHNFSINSIAVQSDGKILAGGAADGVYLALTRYNTDGSLDNTFNGNGKLTDIARAGNTGFKSTLVQKDGKIIAAGSKWNGNNYDFATARYNTDGSPDNTFSGDGIQTTDFASKDNDAKSVVIQNDGKIIVAGGKYFARYNTDGSLDNAFSGDGKQTTSIEINSAATQSDGKIVIAGVVPVGEDTSYIAIERYNIDGSLDKTFGVNGQQTIENGYLADAPFLIIQNDGKIVLAGYFADTNAFPYGRSFTFLYRYNTDGNLDTTFNHGGVTEFQSGGNERDFAITKQNDDKIVIAGSSDYKDYNYFALSRFNVDGSIDSSFKGTRLQNSDEISYGVTSIALQSDGKIVVAGDNLYRFTADGRFDSTFDGDGIQTPAFYVKDIAIANNKLYAAGGNQYGSVARYLLDNSSATPPTVTLTSPANNTTRLAPAAHIKLSAVAADKDGTITKVEFYNGTKLLHTETVFPYGYVWRNVGLGNYTLTAKAYDNSGLVTTSAPVHISVVPNKAPVVSIITPSNNQSFAAPAYIHFEAAASDSDGRITNVKFYNGSTLLRTEYKSPYTYVWKDVPGGTYTITAVATDNWGAQTTSAPVTVRVTSPNTPIVSGRPIDNKTGIIGTMDIKLAPNPATNAVNIYMNGLQQNKPVTISVISVSGIVMKTMQINNSIQTIQLDVSSLVRGVYTIKVISGDKMTYKQFVKL